MRPRPSEQRGQASVELVAVLPVVAVLGLLAWQGVATGYAAWLAAGAARAAARANAVGSDPRAAARESLPSSLERGLRVRKGDDGQITIAIPIRSVVGGARLMTLSTSARFEPQG